MAAGMAQQVLALLASSCSMSKIPYPDLFGAEFINLEAHHVSGYSASLIDQLYIGHRAMNVTNLDFCNVTLTHTHPGQNDTIKTQVWLPAKHWNGRMQGIGGGGFSAGFNEVAEIGMAGGVSQGYATVTTDGGHDAHSARTASSWALLSPGNVDLYALQDFSSVSLGDAAAIGKDIIESFYGRRPSYSYWNGCSTGGRQGYMLAQRYPTAYDGIHAAAPAIYWNQLLVGGYWPQLVMQQQDKIPHPCELEYITNSAIEACDENDGVKDGIITYPKLCHFNALAAVGQTAPCLGTDQGSVKVSRAAATVANAAWRGPHTEDYSFMWYGMNHDAILTGDVGVANTNCTGARQQHCTGVPFTISEEWIRLFVKKDPNFDVSKLTYEEYESIFLASKREYQSIIGTDEPDLGEFRKAGGKLITFHGMADTLITPRATEQYHDSVRKLYSDIHSFYRLFQAPGLGHCVSDVGAYPYGIFERLVEWVENGTAPDSIVGEIPPKGSSGKVRKRLLCPYPWKAQYDGQSDPDDEGSYICW